MAHTVAVPDWRDVVSVADPGALDRSAAWVLDVVEECRQDVYDDVAAGQITGGAVGAVPPEVVLVPRSALEGPGAFQSFIATVAPGWRLDVLDAVEAAADEVEG